jgi:UDP-N-acetylmuramoyl-L-alanyl-D-glutamate--2,6-diaminopimelate ligase
MKPDEMLRDVAIIRSSLSPGLRLQGVSHDSRRIDRGDAFVAVRGFRRDGIEYVQKAVEAGAAAVVVGRGRFADAEKILASLPRGKDGEPVGLIEVDDERMALALMSRNAAGRPDMEMKVIGITGTNGKTTTTHLLAAISEAAGERCGLLGTVEYRIGDDVIPAERTTPEATEIQDYLRRMREAGAAACVMEVSSHALDLRRVEGLEFAAAVFTNLTRDHLDYHRDMESYFEAKRRLFLGMAAGGISVLNADDVYGRRLAGEGCGRPVLYGTNAEAEYRLLGFEGDMAGTTLRVAAEGAEHEIRSPLLGRPNTYNVLAAAAAARGLGYGWEAVRAGLSTVAPVPGRLERVDAGQPFAVLVDYAHTDDALRNVLETLRPLTTGRLLIVFGAGGDRDTSKRAPMGRHAARLADQA